jgi:hypothetical protein
MRLVMPDQSQSAPPRPPPRIRIGARSITLPRSRPIRLALGAFLVLLGCLGFLPILGFWMIPLGLAVLSYDWPPARRFGRRMRVWLGRLWQSSLEKRGRLNEAAPKSGRGGVSSRGR